MSTDARDPAWFTEQQVIVVVMIVSVVLAALVVLPYLQYVLFGIVLAYVMWPLRQRLIRHLRQDYSALVLTIVVVISVPIPFLYLLREVSRQAVAFLETVEDATINLSDIESSLLEWGIEIDLEYVLEENQEMIAEAIELIAREMFGVAQSLPHLLIGLTITIFVLFVLLRDGHRLIRWTETVLPIRDELQTEFRQRLDRLMWASVVGNVLAGLIQAVALGIGFWLLGFDSVLFLTVLTFVLALLPLVGAFAVWLPITIYLAVTGQLGTAAILFVFGSLVSVSDFYTRPVIIGHSAALNSAVIVVGVFGGLVAFGPIGLLIGPVLLGSAKIAVETTVAARNHDLENATGN